MLFAKNEQFDLLFENVIQKVYLFDLLFENVIQKVYLFDLLFNSEGRVNSSFVTK